MFLCVKNVAIKCHSACVHITINYYRHKFKRANCNKYRPSGACERCSVAWSTYINNEMTGHALADHTAAICIFIHPLYSHSPSPTSNPSTNTGRLFQSRFHQSLLPLDGIHRTPTITIHVFVSLRFIPMKFDD